MPSPHGVHCVLPKLSENVPASQSRHKLPLFIVPGEHKKVGIDVGSADGCDDGTDDGCDDGTDDGCVGTDDGFPLGSDDG